MALALLYLTLLGFVPYLFLVWRAGELRWSRVRATIVTFAVLFRLALLASPPLLSNDGVRYLWTGRLQILGLNPYSHAPDTPAAVHWRDEHWTRLEHRDSPAVYPPLLLLLFRLVAHLNLHPWTFKLVFTAADLLTWWFLVQLLRARKQNESLSLIWALNPLVILEFAGNGHGMSLAILFFVVGLWLHHQRLTPLAALGYAAATLTHPMALPLAITMLTTSRTASPRIWLWYGLPILAGFALFVDAGRSVWEGWVQLLGHRQFNGSLYELVSGLLDGSRTGRWAGMDITHPRTKTLFAVCLLGLWIELIRRRVPPLRATLTMAGALLLLSAVVQPRYVTWLVALVCLEFSLGWLMFSATILVSYVARVAQLQVGVGVDTAYARWLQYLPLYLLLAGEWWRNRFDTAQTAR